MKFVVLNESMQSDWFDKIDRRCAITPASVKKLVRLGVHVAFESGAGLMAGYKDDLYIEAGANVFDDAESALKQADVLLTVNAPNEKTVKMLPSTSTVIGHLDPFFQQALIETISASGITSISVEMIPRSSRAQKMDALSSQASLAGYVMVMQAANHYGCILPMMMTPSGTIKPAKVFIIGAGVAGLQAIATAKRLGASVTAYDTRDVVAEQVESLGAKFLKIDLGDTGQTKDGYANELTEAQKQLQQDGQKAAIIESDIVITTAQLFGRRPPRLISADVVAKMKPGSVIVDMAAQNGGNVEGSVAGETVSVNGVFIVGNGDWPQYVARAATDMYANNLYNLIEEFYSPESGSLILSEDDDIANGCVITQGGSITNDMLLNAYRGN
ncbi:NAD(P) transhydrogenase subunit alpha [Alteromonas facilis]|uniref:NAD(P) transhydrogenase subunit alpha n=1 Tax=Alteromonas facilis TaxID=2048004 RepID=UPI000C28209C|nr:NAD(P) transhydrogenase subunit alpha [Alteromonas facilis]